MVGDGAVQRRAVSLALSATALVVALTLVARFAGANGGDLPPQVLMQAFLKPGEGRLELLVRVPLVLLGNFGFPKRGPGYLDLTRIDDRLREATVATARQIELFETGERLAPMRGDARVALLSDRSFQSYATARAHLREPRLPLDTDLYWNQGFLDVELEYPITSPRADFSVRVNVAPELGQRVKLHPEFLPIGRPARVYDLPRPSWRMLLDPLWYEAALSLARSGFVVVYARFRSACLVLLAGHFRQFTRSR